MGDILGQMNFMGQEVTAFKLDIPGMGVVDYTPPDGAEGVLRPGDRIRFTVEAVIDVPKFPSKYNNDLVETEPMKYVPHVKIGVPQCLVLDAVLRREELEKAWEEAVG